MASGVTGGPGAVAAQHVGPGYRILGVGVTVPRLDDRATTALAGQPRQKTATLGNVQVGKGRSMKKSCRHSTLGRFGTLSHWIKEHEHWL